MMYFAAVIKAWLMLAFCSIDIKDVKSYGTNNKPAAAMGTAKNRNHMGRIITLLQPWRQLKIEIIWDE